MKNDFPHDKVLISVGVQKMVNSKAAGVMFTLNPTNGDISKVVIEGSWGLGETVVSGSVNPDKFVVDKVMLEINERTISTKHIECVYDLEKGQVVNADIDSEMQCTCCLEDQEIKELVKTAKIIESHYGWAMDIEWAIDKDFTFPKNIFIVQARPETVWSQRQSRVENRQKDRSPIIDGTGDETDQAAGIEKGSRFRVKGKGLKIDAQNLPFAFHHAPCTCVRNITP